MTSEQELLTTYIEPMPTMARVHSLQRFIGSANRLLRKELAIQQEDNHQIVKVSPEGKILGFFASQVECANELGVTRSAVHNAIERQSLLCGQFYVHRMYVTPSPQLATRS